MIDSPISPDHARIVSVVKADYYAHCFHIHESGQWSHQPWDCSNPQENWEAFADEYGFEVEDATLKTMYLDEVANCITYYTNLISSNPTWSPYMDDEDTSEPEQVMADYGDDPINID